MIRMESVTKAFGRTRAVDALDLHVPAGEVFGFIGPNGAGKTTTIKMMAGLVRPDAGRIVIDGIDLSQDPVRAKQCIGLVPDRPFLYEKLTAWEFMRFCADLYGVNGKGFEPRSKELLRLFSLTRQTDELIEGFSHGMKQRLIMAAALLHRPPLLIVDEPMVGLDPRGIRMVRELFRHLADQGATIFISTHTLRLAEQVCDRIGIIDCGKLVATGTLGQLQAATRSGLKDLEQIFFQLTAETEALSENDAGLGWFDHGNMGKESSK